LIEASLMTKTIAYIASARLGLESFVYSEIVELIKSGYKIILFTTKYAPGPYMPKQEWDVYKINPLKIIFGQPYYFFKRPKKYLQYLWQSIRLHSGMEFFIANHYATLIEKINVDHIHCQMADKKLYIGYFISKLIEKTLTVTLHAHELYEGNPNKRMFPMALNACEKVITISDFNKKILIDKFNLPEEKAKVIRLFGDTDKLKNHEKTKILIVGHWVKKKGHEILLQAAKNLNRNDFIIWIVGGKVQQHTVDVKKIVERLKIEDKVLFFGRVSDEILDLLYTLADIFCLPSYYTTTEGNEGIPVVLMEAMMYGKPVISTKHAGIPELVEEILVEENDVKSLEKALEYLLNHPEKWDEMGKRNEEIIKRKYSKKNIIALREIFDEYA